MAERHILQDFLLHARVTALHLISIFKTLLPPYLIFTTGVHSLLQSILS